MKTIFVKTQFEGIHSYPDAPEEVLFLRNEHRHMFHVRLEIEVMHDDRELEFIMVKRALDAHLAKSVGTPTWSCEMIGEAILDWATEHYCNECSRFMVVSVSEDGENGARVDNVVRQEAF